MASTTNDPVQPPGDGNETADPATASPQPEGRTVSGEARAAGRRVKSASLAGLRALMPAIEAYAGRRADTATVDAAGGDAAGATAGAAGADDGEADRAGLTRGEQAVLLAAGQKAFAETLAVTTRSHPVPGTEPYTAATGEAEFQTPNLGQLYSLYAAAQDYLRDDDDDDEPEPEPEPEPVEARQVAYLAVAPGEYQVVEGPITPTQARRSAMRQRSYAPPPPAVLATSSQQFDIVPAGSGAGYDARSAGGTRSSRAHGGGGAVYGARTAWAPAGQGGPMTQAGCARCGCVHPGWSFPPARYDEDGDCKSVISISCDTKWRLRECLKVSFCELLRCLGEELCEDGVFKEGKQDFGRCLEGFACTLIACLPEAICPSRPEPRCLPADALSCGCNFAVGE